MAHKVKMHHSRPLLYRGFLYTTPFQPHYFKLNAFMINQICLNRTCQSKQMMSSKFECHASILSSGDGIIQYELIIFGEKAPRVGEVLLPGLSLRPPILV